MTFTALQPAMKSLAAEQTQRPWPTAALLLPAVLTLVALPYLQMHDDVLLFLDDSHYLSAGIRRGFSWQSITWAFGYHAANWHPLTWLSLMADWPFAGLHAGWYKFHNLLLHIGSCAALFLFLRRAGEPPVPAALATLIFGLHPLRVSSVAWVAERKDCLCVLLCLGTMLAYQAYAGKPSLGRYAAVTIAFVLALLAKPLAVTLPAGLLLLDIWPLRRLEVDVRNLWATALRGWPLVAEKLPWLGLATVCAVITVEAQMQAGAVATAAPLWWRMGIVFNAYGTYLWQLVMPGGHSVLYPVPPVLPWVRIAAAAAALTTASTLAIRSLATAPWLAAGWGWFLVTMLPMSGIVSVGEQAHADRYTYLPHLLLIAAIVRQGRSAFNQAERAWRRLAFAMVAAWLVLLGMHTARWTAQWDDTERLFLHSLRVTMPNPPLTRILGAYYEVADNHPAALEWFHTAATLNPGDQQATLLLLRSLVRNGEKNSAEKAFAAMVSQSPAFADAVALECWRTSELDRLPTDDLSFIWTHCQRLFASRGEHDAVAEAIRRLERDQHSDSGSAARRGTSP